MPDRPKVMIQTKWDTLVLQVGVGCRVSNPTPQKALILVKLVTIAAGPNV
jgi:hypothetical protein